MPIDLEGWSLGDTSLAGFLRPVPPEAGFVLNSGEYAVLIPFDTAQNQTLLTALYPLNARIFTVGDGNSIGSGLNNNNDFVYIYDAEGNVVDTIFYKCDEPSDSDNREKNNCAGFEAVNDPANANKSIERQDANDTDSFVISPPGGTPGTEIEGGVQNLRECTSTTREPTFPS